MLSTRDQLEWMQARISAGRPFFHTRYNDGEALSMLHLRSPQETTSGEHHFTPDIGNALRRTFEDLCRYCVDSQPTDVLVGSFWYQTWWENSAKQFIRYLDSTGYKDKIPWAPSDLWYSTELEEHGCHEGEYLIELIEAIREAAHFVPVVLVGNRGIREAKFCLDARFVTIPKQDAWDCDAEVRVECRKPLHENPVYVWCAGFPAKVWAWSLWRENPGSTHVDAGHLFDGVFDRYSRAWLRRQTGTHFDYYRHIFTPYVKSFIQ